MSNNTSREAYIKNDLAKWKKLYTSTLLNDVMPFWVNNCIDADKGCINNCVDDGGNILSKSRFIWSQGRALWTFSALYNRIEKRKEWLDIADGLFNYLIKNGRNENGNWMYLLDENEAVIEGDTSISVDGFVMNGMCEYYAATNNGLAAKIALETYENTYDRLKRPGSYGIAPYDLPDGMKIQGINMMFSSIYYNLGKVLKREDICQAGYKLACEVLTDFYDKDKDAILEFITVDNSETNHPISRVCIPGHVIECMWFLIEIFEHRGDNILVKECSRLIKRHIELGWDKEFAGILLAIDIDGKQPVAWNKHSCKPWWTQVEALVATIFAYKHTKDETYLDWHEKIQKYAYSHYPTEYGEWTQWLDKYGNVGETAALPVKDPFHLPRGLIYMMKLLKDD